MNGSTRLSRRNFFFPYMLMALTVLLSGCVTSTSGPVNAEENRELLAIATSGLEQLTLRPGTGFSWKEPMKVLGLQDDKQAIALLTGEIESDLTGKGFRMTNTAGASYLLKSVAILGDVKRYDATFPDPGLQPRAGSPEKGSLVIEIRSTRNEVIWRGTVQLFTDPDLSAETKVKRAHVAVVQLLREIVPTTEPVQCKEPRPQICTMIYDPVCGHVRGGGSKDYPSGCSACADPQVVSYEPGTCSGE